MYNNEKQLPGCRRKAPAFRIACALILCSAGAPAESQSISVSGCVVDSTGRPRQSATIELDGQFDRSPTREVRDPSGRFSIMLPAGSPQRPVTTRLRASSYRRIDQNRQADWVSVTNTGEPVHLAGCLVAPGFVWGAVQVREPDMDLVQHCEAVDAALCGSYFKLRLDCSEPLYCTNDVTVLLRRRSPQVSLNARLPVGVRWNLAIVEQPPKDAYSCRFLTGESGVAPENQDAEYLFTPHDLAEIECRLTTKGRQLYDAGIAAKREADEAYARELEEQNRPSPATMGDSPFGAVEPVRAPSAEEFAAAAAAANGSAAPPPASMRPLSRSSGVAAAMLGQAINQAQAAPPPAAGGATGSLDGDWRGDNAVTVTLKTVADGLASAPKGTTNYSHFRQVGPNLYRFNDGANFCLVQVLGNNRFDYSCGSHIAYFDRDVAAPAQAAASAAASPASPQSSCVASVSLCAASECTDRCPKNPDGSINQECSLECQRLHLPPAPWLKQ